MGSAQSTQNAQSALPQRKLTVEDYMYLLPSKDVELSFLEFFYMTRVALFLLNIKGNLSSEEEKLLVSFLEVCKRDKILFYYLLKDCERNLTFEQDDSRAELKDILPKLSSRFPTFFE